jgi:putative endopeptidase
MKKSLLLIVVLVLAGCVLVKGQQTYLDQTKIDRSIKPGDDFYTYSNGSWLKANEIPATESSWGNGAIIRKETRHRLQDLVTGADVKLNKLGSDAQKLQDFYYSGMNTLTIERIGIKPLLADFKRIDAINSIQDVIEESIAQNATGLTQVAPLFEMGALPDPATSEKIIVAFSQGGMGLPEKSYYFDKDVKAVAIRQKYIAYLQQLLQLSGTTEQQAKADAVAIFSLETRLAKGARTATENRNIGRLLNYYTLEKAEKQFPLIGWSEMLKTLNIPSNEFLITQPEFLDTLGHELKTTPVKVWKNYLKVRLLSNSSKYLSKPFEAANFAFYSTALTGQTQMKPRGDQIISITDEMIGELLGKLYVEKYFSAQAKKRIDDLVQNVLTTFGERIKSNTWMTDSTKQNALKKLGTVRRKIAYPNKWKDYSSLSIGKNYYQNIKAASAFNFRYEFSQIGKPVDRDRWTMTPPTLNAYYNPLNNEIVFPAGILLPPFFDANADDAVNYGGIATVIGHEISHGFDDQGSQFDSQGRFKGWWTKTDLQNFEAKGNALAKQFDQYVAVDTLHVNGRLTLGENIGDLCGITVAYQAFKKTAQGKSNKLIDGLTPDQRFFLAYAAIWRTKQRDESLRNQVLTNPHSPAKFRIIGPLSNFQPFYDTFQVKQTDKMWRPVNERVAIW